MSERYAADEGRVTVLPDHAHSTVRFPGPDEVAAAMRRAVEAGDRDVAVVVDENSTPDPTESADYVTVVDRAADGLIEGVVRRRNTRSDRLVVQTGRTDDPVPREAVLAHLRGEELDCRPDAVVVQDVELGAKFELEGTPAAMLEALMAHRVDRFAPGESTAARAAGDGPPDGDVLFLNEDASHPQVRAAKDRVERYKDQYGDGELEWGRLREAWADQTLRRDRALRDRVAGLVEAGVAPGSIVVRRGAAHPAAKLLAAAGLPVEYGYEKGGLLHGGSVARVSNERRAREELTRVDVPYSDWASAGPEVGRAIRDHARPASAPASPGVPDVGGSGRPVGGDVPDLVAVVESLTYGAPEPDRNADERHWPPAVGTSGERSSRRSPDLTTTLPSVPETSVDPDADRLVEGLDWRLAGRTAPSRASRGDGAEPPDDADGGDSMGV